MPKQSLFSTRTARAIVSQMAGLQRALASEEPRSPTPAAPQPVERQADPAAPVVDDTRERWAADWLSLGEWLKELDAAVRPATASPAQVRTTGPAASGRRRSRARPKVDLKIDAPPPAITPAPPESRVAEPEPAPKRHRPKRESASRPPTRVPVRSEARPKPTRDRRQPAGPKREADPAELPPPASQGEPPTSEVDTSASALSNWNVRVSPIARFTTVMRIGALLEAVKGVRELRLEGLHEGTASFQLVGSATLSPTALEAALASLGARPVRSNGHTVEIEIGIPTRPQAVAG